MLLGVFLDLVVRHYRAALLTMYIMIFGVHVERERRAIVYLAEIARGGMNGHVFNMRFQRVQRAANVAEAHPRKEFAT